MNSDAHDREDAICDAIDNRNLVRFMLDGCLRIGEPHDYGIAKGERKLFFFQTAGESRSGSDLSWRWAKLDKIVDFVVLPQRFAGPRPIPANRHQEWDRLIASVSRDVPRLKLVK